MSPLPRRNNPVDDDRYSDPKLAEPLFRQQAMDQQQTPWLGTVLLDTHSVYKRFAWASLAIVLALFIFMNFGTLSRKVPVAGWLVPETGLSRVYSPQPGIVAEIFVRAGQTVAKGAKLVAVSGEVRSDNLVATREKIVSQLKLQRDSLRQSRIANARVLDQQYKDAERRLTGLLSELRFFSAEMALQEQNVRLSAATLARERKMRQQGLISLPRLDRTRHESLERSAKYQSLLRTQGGLQRELITAKSLVHELPIRRQNQLGEIDRMILALDQQIAEAETRRRLILVAPQDGIVASLQAELGSHVGSDVPIVSVVPANSKLVAHVYSPSRGIGFVKVGQTVQLRLQAFPYQKFGFLEGKISSVSSAPISASELPQHLKGIAGGAANQSGGEPTYRIVVKPSRTSVLAYGRNEALRPGMRLDADIFTDRRRLVEWMFDPLLAITGKWRG